MTRKKAESIIMHARKGQDFIARKLDLLRRGESSILTPEYLAEQEAMYAKYQQHIDNAQKTLTT